MWGKRGKRVGGDGVTWAIEGVVASFYLAYWTPRYGCPVKAREYNCVLTTLGSGGPFPELSVIVQP